ncbi:hypothetical protein AB0F77_30200 [Streptomyces sp. NPDC026672]|uniref:hypothetical protein n=1 Tax=unclassified Streptomyces TaxID=2593676 RepID=UPI0033F7A3FC
MEADRLPARVREFANYLDGLLARLDQGGGWCGVFWQRDPDGMRACLDGRELPPWDVVEALLQDLAVAYGPDTAVAEKERARLLHTAALTAYDARPGARDALGDRLDVMLREQRYAAERQAALGRSLASAATADAARALRLDLAWARDDHDRATARCAELRARMAELDRSAENAAAGGPDRDDGHGTPVRLAPDARSAPADAPAGQRRRRRGSARFAGMAEDDTAPAVVPQAPAPDGPAAGQGRRTPRGARFAGAATEPAAAEAADPSGTARRTAPRAGPGTAPTAALAAAGAEADAEARRAVERAVGTLVRLRGEGRSGEAHALLAEIAHWPAVRLPLLAAALHRTGHGADWATLLWEAVSLPAERLVAAADALAAAGRAADGEQLLRQGVARPADEIGTAVLALGAEGREREVRALLDAYVRVRTPQEAARSAAAGPRDLVPLLLEAARGVSDERHWDLLHALRVAGFTA